MNNQAAWITGKQAYPLKVDTAPMPKAGPGEVVIKNAAIAINPVDWKIQQIGFFLNNYPMVLGIDVAGEIYEVGPDVTQFKKGDRVISQAVSLETQDPSDGGFQLYTKCKTAVVSQIPDSLDFTSAAVLPLSISTAACCLFKKETLALPFPSVNPQPSNKSVLVWGGSSSIGASAIQLAVAAGLVVVAVASKHNIENVKALGAKHVFDYNSSTVTDDIVAALKGTEYAGVCDCIGSSASEKAWTPVYEKLGGRYGTVVPQPSDLPEGIEGSAVYAISVLHKDKDIGDAVWGKFIPEALEKGTYKAKPDPIVVGKGLEYVQEGMDRLKKGVSYGKIVVTL
ncbi:oxidoreductase-like protein [Delitschia confertaspora ATCC 74209]|uniref:Oxidoreductase-like protein n=1 Tax=Delitschia confertaspora ATCC 74209 TaxID=1513339 RepID=A0A9P4MLS4_9PLEO|nr:oxidoreductase-like protein [Delitschia confertaspora ATCC 74209]